MSVSPKAGQPRQLSLNVQLSDQATFDNFYLPDQGDVKNLVTWLRDWASAQQLDESFVFLWGASGSGRSHLLQACCHLKASRQEVVQYLPLRELMDYPPQALFDGLAEIPLLCIDDVHLIEGNEDWEAALFELYNQMRDGGNRLLVSGESSPRTLTNMLPDLVSRLSWGPVFQLPDLDDEQKKQMLIFRADKRGIVMNHDVAGYLINRVSRDMQALIALLDKLDRSALEQKRALTIPFVRSLLSE